MNSREIFRNVGTAIHSVFAISPTVAQIYLSMWSRLLRELPESPTKYRIINTIRSTRWHNLSLKPQTIQLGSRVNVQLTPHLQEFDFDALFFKEFKYESEVFAVIEERANVYDGVIEIGANVGVFTVFFAKLFASLKPNIQIFAFEPSFEAFFRLQQNIRSNAATNVHLFNCAIGEQTGFTQFHEPEGHLTNGSLLPEFASIFSANVRAREVLLVNGDMLTQLVKDCLRPLVKIDVEGAERIVLESMKQFILEKKPDIVLEVLGFTEEDLNGLTFLLETYDLFNITLEGLIKHTEFKATEHRDYLLVAKSTPS